MKLKAVTRIRTGSVFRVSPRSGTAIPRRGAKAALAMYRRRHRGIAERDPKDGSWSFFGDDGFECYTRRGESVGVQAGVRFHDTAAVLLWVDGTADAAVRTFGPLIHYGERLVERIDEALAGKAAARAAFAAGVRTCPDCETAYSPTVDCACFAADQLDDYVEFDEDDGGFGADERDGMDGLLETEVEAGSGRSSAEIDEDEDEDEDEEDALDQAIEAYRIEEAARIAAEAGDRASLERRHGEVWDEQQLAEEFEVLESLEPILIVRRKSELKMGTVKVQDCPRFYFAWEAAD